jgi:hypothetical protein
MNTDKTTMMKQVAPIFSRNEELASAVASGDVNGIEAAMSAITVELQEAVAGVPYVQAAVAKQLKKTLVSAKVAKEAVIDYITSDSVMQSDLKSDMKSPLGRALIAAVKGPVLDQLVEEGVESKVVAKATETKLRKLGIIS